MGLFANFYLNMILTYLKEKVTNKGEIRTWSNSRGDGKLFSMDLMDDSGEIRATAFNAECDKFYNMSSTPYVFGNVAFNSVVDFCCGDVGNGLVLFVVMCLFMVLVIIFANSVDANLTTGNTIFVAVLY